MAVVGWFFVRNVLTPMAYDDYSYAFMWREEMIDDECMADRLVDLDRRVSSLSDVLESQWAHYHTWGGRTVAHFCVQLFVLMGKSAFDAVNALMFGLLIVLIARLASDAPLSSRRVLWIVFGLWLAIPDWILSTQWLTGACNYLWTAVIQLLFLCLMKQLSVRGDGEKIGRPPSKPAARPSPCSVSQTLNEVTVESGGEWATSEDGAPACPRGGSPSPLNRNSMAERGDGEEEGRPLVRGAARPSLSSTSAEIFAPLKFFERGKMLLMIPLGLMAGWSNEASGAVAILLSAYFTARSDFSRRNLIGLFSTMIGYALLMTAPGNFNRLALTHPGFQLTPSLVLEHFNDAWRNVVGGESFLFVPIVWLLLTRRSLDPNIIAFTVAALLVPTAMLFSPQFASYTCLASTVFLLIASTAALDRIELGHSMLIRSIATILISIGVLSMAMSLRADYLLYRQSDAQFDLIERHRRDDCIELPSMLYDETSIELLGGRVMNAYNGRHHTAGLADDPNDYYTRAFAKYHGLNAVRLSDDEVSR